jgi:hypothetical protein
MSWPVRIAAAVSAVASVLAGAVLASWVTPKPPGGIHAIRTSTWPDSVVIRSKGGHVDAFGMSMDGPGALIHIGGVWRKPWAEDEVDCRCFRRQAVADRSGVRGRFRK